MIQFLFFLFAALAVGAAISVLVQPHVLYSALSLIVMLASVSALYILLRAEFLAVIQIIVYAGAIMVLFVFVIMLLNFGPDTEGSDRLHWLKVIGIPMGLFFLAMVGSAVWRVEMEPYGAPYLVGGAEEIGRGLFTDYLLPFEATSILILVAILGAVVLTKKDL